MKVSLFAPTVERCGIADYTRTLLGQLRAHCDVSIVPAEDTRTRADCRRLGRAMNAGEVAHVQYEHAFFLAGDVPTENFAAFLDEIHVPTVLTMHCAPLEDAFWSQTIRRVDVAWIVHTESLRRQLEARGVTGPVDSTPLPLPNRVGARRGAGTLPRALEGKRVLTIFGFTKPHKGHLLAVDALGLLPADRILLIAGGPQDDRDEAYLGAVRRRARDLGLDDRVVVTGYVDTAHVGSVLEASDVVLAPFEATNASASVATAIAWARPVVATSLDPFRELAQRFGCLRLVPPGDATALAGAVETVLTDADVRAALRSGAERHRKKHDAAAFARRTRSLYARLCAPVSGVA